LQDGDSGDNQGEMLALSGSRGYGEHHDEPVFYIARAEPTVDQRTYSGWQRHEERRVRGQLLKPQG
jgi:hypothetical protein